MAAAKTLEEYKASRAKHEARILAHQAQQEPPPRPVWNPSMKSRGIGDTVKKITHATGVDKVVEKISEVTGIPCGCGDRQIRWNEMFKYKEG